jgi:MAPEG family
MGLVLRPALGIAGAYFLWRVLTGIILVDPAAATAERVGLACAALLPGVLVLNLMIALQMLARAWSRAIDPLAGVDNRFLQLNQRALTNTVEQLAGFVPALMALAAGAPPGRMPGVVALGLVFGVARLVFWGGYLMGPLLRAPGMAATFAVNVATYAAAAWVWWP